MAIEDEVPSEVPHEVTDRDILNDLSPKERVEEAHGLWELAVTRVATFAEMIVQCKGQGLSLGALERMVRAERDAFNNWQATSRECGA